MTSSTSNSNSDHRDGAPLRRAQSNKRKKKPIRLYSAGFAAFIVFMLLLELLVFRNLYFYGLSPGNIGQLGELKASFAAVDEEQVKVAILGDSQSMDALRPELMAEHTPYTKEQIFNFSISGGSAYDIEKVYRQYESKLLDLEHAIVVVNEHQFNEARTVEDIKFKYFADLGDRLKVMDKDNYGELLLGYVFKAYDMRTVWTMMIEKYQEGELRDQVPVHEGGLPAVTWSPRTSRTAEYAQETADRWFEDFRMGGPRSDSFESLIRDLRAQDVEVTVIQLPRHEWFEQAITEHYPDERAEYEAFLRDVTDAYGAELWMMLNEGLELEEHFRDTNHVSVNGAEVVSFQVAERLMQTVQRR